MTITIVATAAQLIAALHGAITGDTIELAPGTYSKVAINGESYHAKTIGTPSQVYIQSEFSNNPAVITDMTVSKSEGIWFKNLAFSTATDAAQPYGAGGTTPFTIGSSGNIAISNSTFAGSPTGTLANTVSGLYIRDSTYVHIANSSFEYLHYAIAHTNDNQISVTNSTFNHLFDDGVRGGGTSNITISGNSFTNMHFDPTDTDHPDTIQFWTTNTTKSSGNITITNNTYVRGADGGAVQGIFINDEVGSLPYYNVNISGNNYTGAQWNGLMLDHATSGVVDNNSFVSYPDYRSWIGVYNSSKLSVEGNQAASYIYTGSTGLTLLNNQVDKPVPNPYVTGIPGAAGGFLSGDSLSAVPEPVTWSLMCIGLGLVGVSLRSGGRRRRTVAKPPLAA